MRIKLRKSIKEAKGFDAKGYTILREGSTAKAAGVPGLSKFLNRGYDFLQRKQDFDSFKRTMKGESIDIGRRAGYRIGGRITGKFMNMFVPDVPGLAGRILRIGAGQVSSKVLNKVTNPLRVDLKSHFQINANAFDNKVKDMARRGMPAFDKIQKSIQAVAINTAPDYYALDKVNKNKDGDYNNNVLSAYSLKDFTPEEIDSLMSSSDMRLLFDRSELAGAGPETIFDVLKEESIVGNTIHGKPEQIQSLSHAGTFETKEQAEAYIQAQKSKGQTRYKIKSRENFSQHDFNDVFTQTKQHLENSGEGALYGFGGVMPTTKELEDLIQGAFEFVETLKSIPHSEIQDRIKNLPNGRTDINLVIGILQNIIETPGAALKMKGMAQTLRLIRGDITELYGNPIKQWKSVRYAENKVGDKAVINAGSLSDNEIKDWNDYLDARYNITDTTQRREQENLRKARTGQKRPIGSKFDKRGKKVPVKTGEKHPVIEGQYHQSRFTDNKMRHNYVPSRQQIQKAIHSLPLDTKDPDTLLTYTVAFGGKTPMSKSADEIRDAFQIEFGGPGTDKQGGLRNRTDNFVFTPSLFMFNSLRATATAFGLDKPSANKFRLGASNAGVIATQTGKKNMANVPDVLDEDISMNIKGINMDKQTRRTLNELNARAKTANLAGDALFQDGKLVLDKNKILQSSIKNTDLEIINEVLNDTIFGGAALKGKFQNATARAPFEKALQGQGISLAGGQDIAQQIVIQDRNRRAGMATYGRQTVTDMDIFEEAEIFKASDLAKQTQFEDPSFVKFTKNGVTTVIGQKVTRKVAPGTITRQGDIQSGAGLAADPRMALPQTAANANITAFMTGQADVNSLVQSVASAIRAQSSAGLTGALSEMEIQEVARRLVYALGDASGNNSFDLNPSLRNMIGIQTAAIIDGIQNFGKFYRGQKTTFKNRSVVSDRTLDLGDSTRRQITEPTFNEFVALLQDGEILNAIRVSHIKTISKINDKETPLDNAQIYSDLSDNFRDSYREVITSVGDDGIDIAMVSGVKRRFDPGGPVGDKGADIGLNDEGKLTSLADQVLDVNDPATAKILEDGYTRALNVKRESVVSLGAKLRNSNNNLQSPKDRQNALNVVIDRVKSGSLNRRAALNLLIDETGLQLALKERETGRNVGNIAAAPVGQMVLEPAEIAALLGKILAESLFDMESWEFGDKGDTTAQDDFGDIFESPDS